MSGWPHIHPRTKYHLAAPQGRTQTGTTLGLWTVNEMYDYALAVRYLGGQISAWSCPAWGNSDAGAYAQWQQDRLAAIAQGNDAIHAAEAKYDGTPSWLRDVLPAGDAWDQLVSAYTALDGLYKRALSSGCAAPDTSQMPQPQASDLDITFYKDTGNLVPNAAQSVLGLDWGTIKFLGSVTALVVILYFLHPLVIAAAAAATPAKAPARLPARSR